MNFIHDNRDAYSNLGRLISERQSSELSTQLSVFQSALVNFANEHGDEIKQNEEFRKKFTQMCLLADIDVLELLIITSKKNSKASAENINIGLAVKIVELCQETRDLNGGLISLKELLQLLKSKDNVNIDVKEADIHKALSVLNTLGKGYEIMNINNKLWLKFSSATNSSISNDQKRIYEMCEFMGGYVTYNLLKDNYGWDRVRCKSVIEEMIMNGFLWVDSQGPGGESLFWEPSWISN